MKKYLSFQNSKNRIKHINSDFIGAMSAFLCIIHCMIVPILMGVHSVYYAGDALASVSHIEHSSTSLSLDSANFLTMFESLHWHNLDYFFILITLIAVFFATRKSIVSWVKTALWSAAILFVVSILLEESVNGIEYLAYFASALLIVFHFLNQRLGKKIRLKTTTIKNNELNFEINSFDDVTLKTEIQSKKANRVSCAC